MGISLGCRPAQSRRDLDTRTSAAGAHRKSSRVSRWHTGRHSRWRKDTVPSEPGRCRAMGGAKKVDAVVRAADDGGLGLGRRGLGCSLISTCLKYGASAPDKSTSHRQAPAGHRPRHRGAGRGSWWCWVGSRAGGQREDGGVRNGLTIDLQRHRVGMAVLAPPCPLTGSTQDRVVVVPQQHRSFRHPLYWCRLGATPIWAVTAAHRK
jgi:hypothetical protein